MNETGPAASSPRAADTGTVHLRPDDTLMIPTAAERWAELLLALADTGVPTVPGDTGAMRAVAKLDAGAFAAVLRWIRGANLTEPPPADRLPADRPPAARPGAPAERGPLGDAARVRPEDPRIARL